MEEEAQVTDAELESHEAEPIDHEQVLAGGGSFGG